MSSLECETFGTHLRGASQAPNKPYMDSPRK